VYESWLLPVWRLSCVDTGTDNWLPPLIRVNYMKRIKTSNLAKAASNPPSLDVGDWYICLIQCTLRHRHRVVHGLGWPMGWVEIFQFLFVWFGSTTAKVLKIWKDYVNAWIYGQTSWGLRAGFLSCCWGHFKHFFKQLVFEWHNDTVFNMCNDSKEHEEVCLVD